MKKKENLVRFTLDELKEKWAQQGEFTLADISEEEIERRAMSDLDAQPLTSDELARMRRLPNVKLIRENLGLTQEQFANRYHLSVATIRDWEQGRRLPLGPAMNYLYIIAAEPDRAAAIVAEEHGHYGATPASGS